MQRNFLILSLLLSLAACSTYQYDNAKQHPFTPESFFENSRIVMRDVTVPPNTGDFDYKLQNKKKANKRKIDIKKEEQVSGSLVSIKEIYGSSINDKFNGVNHPIMPNSAVKNTFLAQEPKQNIAVATVVHVDHPVSEPIPAKSNIPQPSIQQGTSYIPLTFPVPPPKAMMRQFHMQVGQTDMSNSLN